MTKEKKPTDAQIVCGELYQVIGYLASFGDVWCHPDVVRALDQASAVANGDKPPYKSILPWPKYELCTDRGLAAVCFALGKKPHAIRGRIEGMDANVSEMISFGRLNHEL